MTHDITQHSIAQHPAAYYTRQRKQNAEQYSQSLLVQPAFHSLAQRFHDVQRRPEAEIAYDLQHRILRTLRDAAVSE